MFSKGSNNRIIEGLQKLREGKIFKTREGLKFTITDKNTFKGYDGTVAGAMLSNFGVIFLSEYGDPVDNEYDQESMYKIYKKYL